VLAAMLLEAAVMFPTVYRAIVLPGRTTAGPGGRS